MLLFAAECPGMGAFHRGFGIGLIAVSRSAFVEGHDDVRAQFFLDLHRDFGSEIMLLSIEDGFELHSVFIDFSCFVQGKHLESAGIRKERFVPSYPFMESPILFHVIRARSQGEVIGIGENDFGAQCFHVAHL
ncbi:MAG: hypothetical protein ACD_28C00126G0001 [uncultured bacterium]|nr:MAG: hypothetical protein ACD_28C00126G0001 [uncultured bacterium]